MAIAATTIRVVLADGHAIVRAGLRLLLNAQPDIEVVGDVADGQAAQRSLQHSTADVVIIEIVMPNAIGLQLTEWMTCRYPDVGVVVLAVSHNRGDLSRLLQAGARGYALKRSAADELIQAVRRVVLGEVYVDSTLTAQLGHEISVPPKGQWAKIERALTEREQQVVKLIVHGHSNKECAAQLQISVKTIETHKAHCMEKLGIRSRVELMRLALERGWFDKST